MYSQWLSLSVLFFMMQSLQLRNKAKKKKVFPTAKQMSQMYLNKNIRQIKKHFLTIMYIIRKLIVKLDLKFLLSNRQQKFINKPALMHARVLAAMSHFLSGPLRMRPSGVRGKTYPESVLTGGLSRRCRDIVAAKSIKTGL